MSAGRTGRGKRERRGGGTAPSPAGGWGEAAWGLFLPLLTVSAYATALKAGFIWDDPDYLTENPLTQSLEGLRRIWFTTQTPQYYPLVFTTFWIEEKLWGLDPLGYHAVNVLLHGGSALLVWRLLRRLEVPGAWLAAAIFALHPVHAESVAWVTERKNVLSGLFYFLALGRYLSFEERGGRRGYALALALFICALLSKSVTATLPAAALALLWWRRGAVGKRSLLRLLPFFLIGAASGLFTAWIEVNRVGAAGADWNLGPLERLQLAGRTPWFYLGKLLWPAELVFTYPRWEVRAGDPAGWLGLGGLLLAAFALWRWRERLGRGPAAAGLYFLITLGPILGFLDVYPFRYSFVADHFQYLASLGPIALLAALLARGRERLGLGARAGMAGAGALLALLGLLTLRQGRIYRDEGALWRDTLAKNPASWMAHNNLGHLLARQQKTEEAIRHYREALRLRPNHANALNNLGNALLRQGKAAEAEVALRRALAAEPGHPNARNNLSQALLAQGRLNEAVRELEELIRREPRFAPAHANLGGALLLMGAPMPKATEHFARALGLDPRLAEARFNLALLHAAQGSHAEAIALLREGLRRQPDDQPTRQLLAWELATAPDPRLRNGAEALRLAQGAMQEAGPQALHVLAAALAETGRFEEALRTAREAAARAGSAGLKEDAERIREAIARYERGAPMRSPGK